MRAILLSIFCLFLLTSNLFGIHPPNAIEAAEVEKIEVQEAKKEARVHKKLAKMQRKAAKKAAKPAKSGLFQNGKFKLGAIALAAGLVLSILTSIVSLPGFIGFLGVIGIIAGMVLMGWGLLEHFS